jgi:hypothetical protein
MALEEDGEAIRRGQVADFDIPFTNRSLFECARAGKDQPARCRQSAKCKAE